jgi:hypothetical protein
VPRLRIRLHNQDVFAFCGQTLRPHGFTLNIMAQSAASGSRVFSTHSRNVAGIVRAGFDGTNVTSALPSSLISAAIFEVLQVGASIFLSGVRVTLGTSFNCQSKMELG